MRILKTVCHYQSHYVGHPTRHIPGIEMNTGALGHGLPICIGMALAAKMDAASVSRVHAARRRRTRRRLELGSRACRRALQAGQSHRHLDHNTLQITGHTRDVMSNEPLDEKWRAFGWTVRSVDGHDFAALTQALTEPAGAGQTDLRHRQHGERQRRQLHGKRRQMASRRAERSGIETGVERTRSAREGLEEISVSAPAPSMFTPAAKAMAEKLGLKMGRANLEEFAATLEELAKANPNIVVVTSDSRGSGKLGPFGKALPKQLVEVGIAEQNLVGITAGLAACGKKSFGVSPACFLTARSLEQIKNDVCYSDVPAVLVGISSGVSYGALGSTHHSLHDLAVLRAINNITVIVPADNFETREAIRSAARATKPVFVRFGKAAMYTLHQPDTEV